MKDPSLMELAFTLFFWTSADYGRTQDSNNQQGVNIHPA